MSELLKPVWDWISLNIPWCVLVALFIVSLFFKVPKYEINILGWTGRKIGNILWAPIRDDIKELKEDNAKKFAELKEDTDKQISELKSDNVAFFDEVRNRNAQVSLRLNDIEKKQDLQNMARIRAHVLNFSDDIRRGNQRTKEDYDNILQEDREYEAIIEKYDLENNVYVHAITFINKKYDESMANNSFATY